jgi:hypothetical protein
MTDVPGAHEPTNPATTLRVLIVDVGPAAYPEDGITLLERWANLDPPDNPAVAAISKTTAPVRWPFPLG